MQIFYTITRSHHYNNKRYPNVYQNNGMPCMKAKQATHVIKSVGSIKSSAFI